MYCYTFKDYLKIIRSKLNELQKTSAIKEFSSDIIRKQLKILLDEEANSNLNQSFLGKRNGEFTLYCKYLKHLKQLNFITLKESYAIFNSPIHKGMLLALRDADFNVENNLREHFDNFTEYHLHKAEAEDILNYIGQGYYEDIAIHKSYYTVYRFENLCLHILNYTSSRALQEHIIANYLANIETEAQINLPIIAYGSYTLQKSKVDYIITTPYWTIEQNSVQEKFLQEMLGNGQEGETYNNLSWQNLNELVTFKSASINDEYKKDDLSFVIPKDIPFDSPVKDQYYNYCIPFILGINLYT